MFFTRPRSRNPTVISHVDSVLKTSAANTHLNPPVFPLQEVLVSNSKAISVYLPSLLWGVNKADV